MEKIKTAVIGAGYLGQYHVEKYAKLKQSELVAVCDTDLSRAQKLAKKYRCQALTDYRALLGQVDAVSIATPTLCHHEIGKFCLSNNMHVLMEKPITHTLAEADELIALANAKARVLQVGHLERFNEVIQYIDAQVTEPRFIESTRIAPYQPRGTDVNVVLDLMIHDIDIIHSLVKSPIVDIRANGASVISKTADITNARIEFASGCVANVTASRVSFKTERKMRLFQSDSYMSLDLHKRESHIYRRGQGEMLPGIPKVLHDEKHFPKGDPIKSEIIAFLAAIEQHTPPLVSGEAGKTALKIAIQITEALHQSKQWHLDNCKT